MDGIDKVEDTDGAERWASGGILGGAIEGLYVTAVLARLERQADFAVKTAEWNLGEIRRVQKAIRIRAARANRCDLDSQGFPQSGSR